MSDKDQVVQQGMQLIDEILNEAYRHSAKGSSAVDVSEGIIKNEVKLAVKMGEGLAYTSMLETLNSLAGRMTLGLATDKGGIMELYTQSYDRQSKELLEIITESAGDSD